MSAAFKNFIAGEWVTASEAGRDVNPSNTNDIVGEFPRGSAADTERAIQSAKAAFPTWERRCQRARLWRRRTLTATGNCFRKYSISFTNIAAGIWNWDPDSSSRIRC